MIGDALVGAVWKRQQEEGRPLTATEMGQLMRCPALSVAPSVARLRKEHPYPIQTLLDMEPSDGVWVIVGRRYYVTRRTVYPDIVSGKENKV